MTGQRLDDSVLTDGEVAEGIPGDEAEDILAALRALARRTANPTIRVCLEAAAADIAHLTGVRGATEPPEGDFPADGTSAS